MRPAAYIWNNLPLITDNFSLFLPFITDNFLLFLSFITDKISIFVSFINDMWIWIKML